MSFLLLFITFISSKFSAENDFEQDFELFQKFELRDSESELDNLSKFIYDHFAQYT